MEKGEGKSSKFLRIINSRLFLITVTVLAFTIMGVLAGNVIVKEGSLSIENELNVNESMNVAGNITLLNQSKICLDGPSCNHSITYNGTYVIIE